MYHENAFYPRELKRALFNIGFAVKSVRPKYVFDFERHVPASLAFRLLPWLALHVAPAYEILAMKV